MPREVENVYKWDIYNFKIRVWAKQHVTKEQLNNAVTRACAKTDITLVAIELEYQVSGLLNAIEVLDRESQEGIVIYPEWP